MKVLIVRLSAMGDVVHGIPLLVVLKENFPDWQISWLVEETSAPLLEGHPCLSHLFVVGRTWRKAKWSPSALWSAARNIFAIWKAIRREKFDIAIDLQGLLKSGFWTWSSGAPRRIGHKDSREFAGLFVNERIGERPLFDPEFPVSQRYLEPALHLGANLACAHYLLPPAQPATLAAADALLAVPASERQGKPLVGFCPWSAWPSKNWPVKKWRQLAAQLSGDCSVLILGASADAPAAETIAAGLPNVLNLVGRTNLPVLAEIFRRCQVVVGNDTGPVHLANATEGPRILMLFGSTPPKRTGPVGAGHRTLALDLPCQPCLERICPLKHFQCMENLEVEHVLETVRELLPKS
jgi:heptosyltransferase I